MCQTRRTSRQTHQQLPALADLMVSAPDELAVPSPEDMNIAPPVWTVLRPAWALTAPPTPDVPEPTVIKTCRLTLQWQSPCRG